MSKRTIADLPLAGSRVLVRVDFNLPIEQGLAEISSYDQRLRAALPTIQYLLDKECRVVLCSHLGRPRGQVVESLRMAPVGERLAELLGRPVKNVRDSVGREAGAAVGGMKQGQVALLENLRFYPGEEGNDPELAKQLASLCDFFVMDAFAAAHRAHASTVGVPSLMPSAMGLLVQREVEALGRALEAPDDGRPLAALMGGAKVSDKILVLENLLDRLDHLFIGGGMSVTFLRAAGYGTGGSSIEEDRLDFAGELLARGRAGGTEIHLPSDVVAASRFSNDAPEVKVVPVDRVPEGWFIMDVGEVTARRFSEGLGRCKTIVWNGPMGVFEMPRFSLGTKVVAEAIAGLDQVTSVVGGGSTAGAVEELGLMGCFTHVSTGGGASLEFLEGKQLPGIAALPDA